MFQRKNLVYVVGAIAVIFAGPHLNSFVRQQKMQKELKDNRKLWRSQHLTNYDFALNIVCECGENTNSAITIYVRNPVWQKMTGFRAPRFDAYDTIEKLFQIAHGALASSPESTIVQYDAKRGYPTSITIDPDQEMTDDEIGIGVSQLHHTP